MEIEPYGEGHKIIFSEKKEILPVGVGLIILEYLRQDDPDIGAYRGLMEFQGRDLLSPFHPSYELDTTESHEKALLEGLVWVVQQKERLSAEIFEVNIQENDTEQAFKNIEEMNLIENLCKLEELVDQLRDEGIVEYLLTD
jgi:hypothetical protein